MHYDHTQLQMLKAREYYSKHDLKINFVVSIILILVLYQAKYGLEVLLPRDIGWLMRGDLAGYVILIDMFRHEPWGFPLGDVSGYYYPIGTNVGEVIPLLVKLFSGILPSPFQYVGLLLISSHILTAYFSLRIFQHFGMRGPVQLFATLLMVINPLLLYRFIHPSLTLHWLLLASFLLYFLSPKENSPGKILIYQGGLFVLGGLFFPYWPVMMSGLLVALGIKLWRVDNVIDLRKFGFFLLASFAALFVSWYLIGLVSFSSSVKMDVPNAYGLYGWNLNSFYNTYDLNGTGIYESQTLGNILPSFPTVTWHQYEGFSYLGVGMILLGLIALGLVAAGKRYKPSISLYPLGVVTMLLTLFAISNTVTFNDLVIVKIPLPEFVQKFGDIFRASGRFIWVAYYLILIFILVFLSKTLSSRNLTIILFAGAFFVQVYDLKKMIFTTKFSHERYHTPLQDEHWEGMIDKFDKVMLYPPFVTSNLSYDDYRYFTYFAAKHRKQVNTGYLARVNFAAADQFILKMSEELGTPVIHDDWLYITTPARATELYKAFFDKKIELLVLDGYLVFYSSARKEDLKEMAAAVRKSNDQGMLDRLFKLDRVNLITTNPKQDLKIKLNMYEVYTAGSMAFVKGWAFPEGVENTSNDSVTIFLQSGSRQWSVPARSFEAPDVADFFHDAKYRWAGFLAAFSTEALTRQTLLIGIAITNKISGEQHFQWTNFSVEFEQSFARPLVLKETPPVSESLQVTIDAVTEKSNELKVEGWGFAEKVPLSATKFEVVLSSDAITYAFPAQRRTRPDVAEYFKDKNLLTSGFTARIKKDSLKRGAYSLGILLEDSTRSAGYYKATENMIFAGYPEYARPIDPLKARVVPDSVRAFIDKALVKDDQIEIEGWAFMEGVSTYFTEAYVILTSDRDTRMLPVTPRLRKDIQEYFKVSYRVDLAGFTVKAFKKDLVPGSYLIGVAVRDKQSGRVYTKYLDTKIEIN